MNSQKNDESLVWFITGVSGGIGRELVRKALRRGDRVAGTSRNPEKVVATFKDEASRLLAISMDLRDPMGISNAVKAAIVRFGRIDVLVNNAGYGLIGAFVAGHRGEVVLATKYTNAAAGFTGKPGTDANAGGNQRKNMVQAVETSLKRLGTDYIDFTHPRNIEYMRAPKSKFLSVSVPNQERRS